MNAASEGKTFDQWALVEIMGHQRAAGHVTEETIAGVAMLRVDIPKAPDSQEFITQYIGAGSIFRMTPTTEEMVRAALRSWEWKPPSLVSLPAPAPEYDQLWDQDECDEEDIDLEIDRRLSGEAA